MMNGIDLNPLLLSAILGITVTIILFVIGLPLGYNLALKRYALKPVIETIVTMPLVMPPTVLGFYLLLFLSPRLPVGHFLQTHLSLEFVFSFKGIVLASCIHSLPFMIQPIKNGFQSLDWSVVEASYTLGKGRFETFRRIILAELKPYIFTGIIMTFIHTLGEFGVVLMIGGSIPGVTRVTSIAIYENVEGSDFLNANIYAGILVFVSFTVIFIVNRINARSMTRRSR